MHLYCFQINYLLRSAITQKIIEVIINLCQSLIQLSNDVESNPGPPSKKKANQRFKNLRLNQTQSHNPKTHNIPIKEVVQASHHQADMRYGYSAGAQCCCNALIGLIHLPNSPNYSSQQLDNILKEGNELFRIQDVLHPSRMNAGRRTSLLTFEELPMDTIISQNIKYTIFRHGKSHTKKGALESGTGLFDSLDTALSSALQKSHTVLVMIAP